jgi:glycosyltransferase involved in cell wall biosynthesis
MIKRISYFYRHPDNSYFSIEKLFANIASEINSSYATDFSLDEYKMPWRFGLKNIFKNISFVRKHNNSINHITGDIHYAMFGCLKSNINVLTIHDCVLLYRYPWTNFRYWIIKLFWYKWPVKKADMITVISENTRKDVIKFTKCDPQKIKVISNFVDPSFSYSPLHFNKSRPHILFIGSAPNKNLDRLIEAVKDLPVILDIVGHVNEEQSTTLKSYNIAYHHSTGLSNSELQHKYHASDILAFPSTFEGFGLPIVEAQVCGRPVLTSNLSPMREVAGDGACLIDCYDVSSIKNGLLKIIHDDAYRASIVQKGLENVKQFTLASVASQYAALYKELLEKRKQAS